MHDLDLNSIQQRARAQELQRAQIESLIIQIQGQIYSTRVGRITELLTPEQLTYHANRAKEEALYFVASMGLIQLERKSGDSTQPGVPNDTPDNLPSDQSGPTIVTG